MQACVIEVENQLYELVNPRIVRSTGDDRDLEGCLSIPGYVAYVTRRERVWVVAQDRHGKRIKVSGTGLLGRALQHELDHLDGKLYIDYLDSMDELLRGRARRGRDGGGRGAHAGAGVTPGPGRSAGAGPDGLLRVGRVRRADPRGPRRVPGVPWSAWSTAPDRPSGRRAELTPVPVARRARELDLPLAPAGQRSARPRRVADVAALRPDFGVLADYGQIVPRSVLALPRARDPQRPSVGPAAASWRDADPGHDRRRRSRGGRHPDPDGRGPRHRPDRRPGALAARRHRDAPRRSKREAARRGADLLRAKRRALAGRRARRNRRRASGATLTRPLRREDGRLDPARPAAELERQVRAYVPWPGSFVERRLGRLIVHRADDPARVPGDRPGQLVADGDGLALATDGRPAPAPRAQLAGRPAAWTPRRCVAARRASSGRPSGCASIVPHGSRHRADTSEPGRPVRAAAGRARRRGWRSAASRRTGHARSPTPSGAASWRTIEDAVDPAGRAPRASSPEAFRFDTVADTELPVTDGGPDREGAPSSRRRRADRIGADALPGATGLARAAHAVHLEPGRLCRRLPVLRHRRAWLRARPADGRDRRPGPLGVARRLIADGRRLTNIVFMGMGEPLLNLDRVLAAIEALNDPRRFGLGARHITVSTSGVVPGHPAAHRPRPAVHAGRLAPCRARPAARRARAAQPSLAGRRGRRRRPRARRGHRSADQLRGDDDRRDQRHRRSTRTAMADLLRGDHAHVNLIPMNPVAHTPWTASPMPVIERFAATLRAAGIQTTIRRNRGQEVGAACGQLAAERAGEPPAPAVARRRARLVAESAAALLGRAQPRPGPRPGWGSSRVRRSSPDRREHPRRRPVQPRLRRSARCTPPAPTGSISTSWTATSSRT